MIWFLGVSRHSVDEKQRVAIPARFRDQIAGSGSAALYAVARPDHIAVFPQECWEKFADRLLSEDNSKEAGPQYGFLRRQIALLGEICKLDSQGRIALRSDQLEAAGIGKDVVVFGNIGVIELWSPSHFERMDAEARSQNVENIWSDVTRTV